MTARQTDMKGRASHTVVAGLAILTLAFFTTTANASCFDHVRGASPVLPSGLIAKLAASPSASQWHYRGTLARNLHDIGQPTIPGVFRYLAQRWYGSRDGEC